MKKVWIFKEYFLQMNSMGYHKTSRWIYINELIEYNYYITRKWGYVMSKNTEMVLDQGKVKFGAYVKKHRDKKGITQLQLAEIMGMTPKSISCIERGENYPTQENIFKLADVLDMSLDEYVFSYTRFNETFCIGEINEALNELPLEEQELVINIIKTTCETLKIRKTITK